MVKSRIEVVFGCSLEKVWNIVTSLEEYSWRSDIKKIEVVELNKKFIEYSKDSNYPTTFTITKFELYKCYEFDMENSNMIGHWTGTFSDSNGKSCLVFTETVQAKKFYLKPFLKMYLRKQQTNYINDLRSICH